MKKNITPIIDIKKYGGKQVAVVKGRIMASGDSAEEVLRAVKHKLPGATWRDVLLISVPKGLTVVYRL